MKRRTFLRGGIGASAVALALSRPPRALAQAGEANWRTFEVTTRAEIINPSGATRVWIR